MTPSTYTAPEIEELKPLFPSFELVSLIAVGGMGAVYRAVQVSLDREVAIKLLPRALGENAEFRKQFEEEAKTMARLNHSNLLGVIDFGSVDGMPYIIMEYVHGSSLHDAVNGMPVESQQTAELMIQVVSAIAHAHENGMLHRDIKPANILLDQDFHAKVADFGLAKQAEEEINESVVWGTPGYTAPELMQGANNASVKSEIYALGGVVYFMLTAKTPDPNDLALTKLSRCDPRFRKILKKCMDADPAGRYDSADHLLEDLKRLLSQFAQPMVTNVSGAKPVLIGNTLASPSPLGASAYSSKVHKKGVSKGLIITLLFIAVVGIGSWMYFGKIIGKESKPEIVEVDYSEIDIPIPNHSFESFNPLEENIHEIDGWIGKRIAKGYTFITVESEEADGKNFLQLTNGVAHTTSSGYAEKGYTYILEFTIASDGARELVANKDYRINITLGKDVPAASFFIEEQLPVKGNSDAIERYRVSFDAEAYATNFKEPIGVRIVASNCTLFVDQVELKYHPIKK